MKIKSAKICVLEGHGNADRTYTEKDWTNIESPDVKYYARSKVEAEKAAWDFVQQNSTLCLPYHDRNEDVFSGQ